MKSLTTLAVALMAVLLISCEEPVKKPEIITTASGLQYIITTPGQGAQAQAGQLVSVHYKGMLKSDSSKFDSSYDRGKPFEFPLGAGRVIQGWDEGISLLNVGTKATLIIPAALAYGPADRTGIPANSDLIFEVELVSMREQPKPAEAYDITGIEEQTTESGIKYYKLHEVEEGVNPVDGQTVSMHYALYLADGKKLDSSWDRGQPLGFQLGVGQVIPGWEEGVKLMKIGEKMRMILPSSLGYGEQGNGPVPPNAELIFDMELVGVQ